jgi:hypothetical protein
VKNDNIQEWIKGEEQQLTDNNKVDCVIMLAMSM